MPARRGGPPRKAAHVTGSHAGFASAIARSLPGASEKSDRHGSTYTVGDSAFLTVMPDDGATLFDGDGTGTDIVLTRVPRDEVRGLIEDAWATYAPKRTVTAYRKRRAAWAAQPPVTEADIRAIALALPGANWGPIWGSEPGFRVGNDKKTRFARFGPPEGTKVSNLVPPDDEHALVIFHCHYKPTLLASAPERFFTTAHYGPADEPGTVIVRLTELRHDDLPEIAEILEDSWRSVAPADLIEALG